MTGALTYSRTTRVRDDNALVQTHLPLVRRLAWHVHGSVSTAIEVEDLVQVGLVALVEGVAAFEDRGQVTLKQYLVTRIRGAMIDELRRHAAMTRGAIRRRRDYARVQSSLAGVLGRHPTDTEMAAQMGLSVEKLRQDYASAEAVRYESLDEVYADDQPWFADDTPDAFAQLSDAQTRDRLIADPIYFENALAKAMRKAMSGGFILFDAQARIGAGGSELSLEERQTIRRALRDIGFKTVRFGDGDGDERVPPLPPTLAALF